jgi:carboxyl-terminal processing protease
MKKLLFVSVLFLALFSSCKKDNTSPETLMARDSLYYVMKDWYYWYNMPEATSVTNTTKDNYNDPYKLLEAMRYKTIDRWSYILNNEEYTAQVTGTFVGHGFRLGLDKPDITGQARIAMIYRNSPLYANGVRRGWIVKKINNKEVAPVLLSKDGTAYNNLIGPSQAGITNVFLFINPKDGTEVQITSTKIKLDVNTVLLYDTLHLSTGVVGHLVFESFFNPAPQELATAFASFKANNIKDLILDLRYNSGGILDFAQTLASYIAGDSKQGVVFAKLSYNDKHQEANYTYPFKATTYSLGLPRLIVITSRSTASASEDVINGLKPFVNVVSIGDTTNGKPTGMNGWNFFNKYYIFPVTFKIVNKDNHGDFFDGLIPDKLSTDDITHDFYDRQELCLKEAIRYLETGNFSTKGIQDFHRSPQYSERPEWMNNAIILKK